MESDSDSVLEVVEFLVEELEALELLFPNHPCRKHFRHGKPRLHAFIITQKEISMSASQPAKTYLNAPSTDFTVAALDQYGFAYTGADLSNTTVTSDTPANVTATLGTFDLTTGIAPLTLNQAGGEGTANISITDGAFTFSFAVESYVPVLSNFVVTQVPTATTTALAAGATGATGATGS